MVISSLEYSVLCNSVVWNSYSEPEVWGRKSQDQWGPSVPTIPLELLTIAL